MFIPIVVEFDVLTEETVMGMVFWIVTSCSSETG
jgi:hypothetical protein